MEQLDLFETPEIIGKELGNDCLVVDDEVEDRYSRLRLIPWWDQEKLRRARVLVVGAGALGNEILKNLALLGVGNILVIDLDTVENSNLSRSVLFREQNEGQVKAVVAAERVKEINPDCRAVGLQANVIHDVGLGVFKWADVVIGGLDNREARLAINQACWKVGTPWVDGAIEVLFGMARVFVPPDSACYECTMNETDYQLLNLRRSCALLSRNEMASGKVPTTPTSASIIAGVQVQEAIKLIHGRPDLPVLAGKGWFYNGLTHDSYTVEFPRKENCLSHETYENIKPVQVRVQQTTVRELLDVVNAELGAGSIIELEKELVTTLACSSCNETAPCFKTLGVVSEDEARCPNCGVVRNAELTHQITGGEAFLDKTLEEIGIPILEVITGINKDKVCYLELKGDEVQLLGELDHEK
ncbi:MAG: HesA/MoeB/ThiF family protein [Acidobacteriota bacterium]